MNGDMDIIVQPNQTDVALDHIRRGRTAYVSTPYRIITITAKTLTAFEKAGKTLLRAEGNGYRLRMGRSSIYLFPGQLKISGGAK